MEADERSLITISAEKAIKAIQTRTEHKIPYTENEVALARRLSSLLEKVLASSDDV